MTTPLPDFVLAVGLATVVAGVAGRRCSVGPLARPAAAGRCVPLGAKLLRRVQGRTPAGGVRRPARRLAAADGRQPARRAQPAARAWTRSRSEAAAPTVGGVRPDHQRDPRRPRPQRLPRRGRRADGQRRLHLGRPGHRHPPRGRRQPGRGARRASATRSASATPIRRQVKALVGRGQAVGDRADGRCRSAIIGFLSMTNPATWRKFTESLIGYAMLGRRRRDADRRRAVAQEDRGDHVLMTHSCPPSCSRPPPRRRPRRARCWAGRCSRAPDRGRACSRGDNLHARHRAAVPPTVGRPAAGPRLAARLVAGLTPGGTVAPARPAGRPRRTARRRGRCRRLVAAKLVLAAVAGALGLLLVSGDRRPDRSSLLAVVVTVVCYFLPELLLLQPRPGAAGRRSPWSSPTPSTR